MSSPRHPPKNLGALLQFEVRRAGEQALVSSPGLRYEAKAVACARPSVIGSGLDTERLFSQVFTNSPQPMSITTLTDGRYHDVNESFLSLLGYTREEVIGSTSLDLGIWEKSGHRAEFVKTLKSEGRVRNYETALRGKEGQTRCWLSSADLIELSGEQCILVISSDITERKRAEEALRDVSARLIKVQEEERCRIARELHDGLSQKLALLSVDVEQLSQGRPPVEVRRKLDMLSVRLQEASADIHRLSQQLHPSTLDHLGLVPAVKSLCRQLSARRGVMIEFISGIKDYQNFDKDVALCAYRVIQEALNNVIKHGCASKARVELKRLGKELAFYVTDYGKGFNVEEARLKGRLGLISMKERLRLVNGNLVIRSKPMKGTQVAGTIPLAF